MLETTRREHSVTREALDRLKAALNRIARSKHRSGNPLTCSVCHNLVALEARDICSDENGQIVHEDCYVQRVITSSKTPASPDRSW